MAAKLAAIVERVIVKAVKNSCRQKNQNQTNTRLCGHETHKNCLDQLRSWESEIE